LSLLPTNHDLDRFRPVGQPLCYCSQRLGIVSHLRLMHIVPMILTLCSTHFGYKNFYLRGDDWLIANRWEQLVAMRDKLTFVEMVTWWVLTFSSFFFVHSAPYIGMISANLISTSFCLICSRPCPNFVLLALDPSKALNLKVLRGLQTFPTLRGSTCLRITSPRSRQEATQLSLFVLFSL
jgi:hypothetical protein